MGRRKAKDDICVAALARDLQIDAGAWERVGRTARARRLRGRVAAIIHDGVSCTADQSCYERCPVRQERHRLGLG